MCCVEWTIKPMVYIRLLLAPVRNVLISLWKFPGFKIFISVVASVISYIFHENVLGVAVLVGLVIVDQFTGVWVAFTTKKFSSGTFRNGIVKLLFYMIIVAAFHALTKVSVTLFSWMALDSAALAYLSVTEVISIVENASEIVGLPFPNWIIDRLQTFIEIGKLTNKKQTRKGRK